MAVTTQDELRTDRDRFVAFAFCDADILLELDRAQNIIFAAGATIALIGHPPEALIGTDIFELVVEDQHSKLREIMRMAEDGARIEPIVVRLRGQDGETPPLALSGIQLPDIQGHYFLAIRMGMPSPFPASIVPGSRESVSGLFDKDSFTEVASSRLKAVSESDEEFHYSVFQLGGLSELRARLDEERRIQLLANIGETLRAGSLYGDTAGRLDDERFGVIHGQATDVGDIQSKIEESSRDADPEQEGVQVRTASVDLDTEGLSETEALNALVYTIGRLGEGSSNVGSINKLSEGLATMVEETAQAMSEARIAVDSESFDLLYQPIVDLDTNATHHFEVLARFGDGSTARSPSEFFQFAEDVGLVRDLDLACCRRAIKTLRSTHEPARLSVNLSNSSLCHEGFATALLSLAKENADVAGRLFFDIKETSIVSGQILPRKIIGELRGLGHQICVDDFGAGASILHYLRSIEVDLIKIDSRYLGDLLAMSNGMVFLRSITGLCEGLNITAIASMVEDQSSIKLIRDAGIRYAQGYLFGKPATSIDSREAVAV